MTSKETFKGGKGHKPLFKTEEEEVDQVRLWLDILNDSPVEPVKPKAIIRGTREEVA